MKGIRNPFTYRIPVIKPVVKKLQSTKFYAILLVSVMLVGIFSLSPVISSLINNVIIRSTGRIATATAAPIAYKSEMRGIFVHCASWSGPIDWSLIAQTLQAYRIQAIYGGFLNAGMTYYDSDFLGTTSIYGDQLGQAINACHPLGIKVYASMGVMSGPSLGNYRAVKSDGSFIEWACPIKIRPQIKGMVEELVTKYDIDGFMLDYIRYSDATTDLCYCPECKTAFQEWLGEGTITDWTPFYPGGSRNLEYLNWRNIPVNELVRGIRNWMLAIKPDLEFVLAAWSYFDDCPIYWRKYIGQDTGDWIKNGYLDSVAPMMYTSNPDALGGMAQDNLKYMTGGQEGKIPLLGFITTGIGAPVEPSVFKAIVDKCREVNLDGWIIWRYGGPGVDPSVSPDIRDYLSIIDMPDVFSLRKIQVTPNETEATVTWTTDLPATSVVEYATSPLFNASWEIWGAFHYWDIDHVTGTIIEDNRTVTNHNITITNLLPGTKHYFRIQSQDPSGIATSKVLTFTTSEGT